MAALPVVRVNLAAVAILVHKELKDPLVTVVRSVLKVNLVLLDQRVQKDLR